MIGDDMGIVKNGDNINTININNKNISEIYYGNTHVYSSSPEIAEVVFRNIDTNGNLTLATGSLDGLFDKIKTIGAYVLYYAFYKCTGITGNISFPSLTTIDDSGLYYAFYGCTGITSVIFPALTTINATALDYAFQGCTGITEMHFRADSKSVIEAASGYSKNFGASNATIYFDL